MNAPQARFVEWWLRWTIRDGRSDIQLRKH